LKNHSESFDTCKKAPKESFWEKVKPEVKKIEKKM
jgi:hypothetical protein